MEMLAFGIGTFLYVAVVATDLEYNRVLIFKEPREGKILPGHVIRMEEVANAGSCRVKCFLEPNCVSINVGPADHQGQRTCELKNFTDESPSQTGLKENPGHIHCAVENICHSNPCREQNFICQVGFTAKRYQCVCPDGFKGKNCDEDIDECKDGLHNCEDGSNCENTYGSFNCICKLATKCEGPLATEVTGSSAGTFSSFAGTSLTVPLPTMTTVLNPSAASSTTSATASIYPTSAVVSASCESQWTSFGSSCYKLHTSSKDWENAKKSCQKFGAQLVKIETEEENQFVITKYFGKINGHYWIGLSDLGNEGKWKWTDGTGLTSYTNWGKGQPNNHYNNQHCGAIIKGNYHGLYFKAEWNDDFCYLRLGYICEK